MRKLEHSFIFCIICLFFFFLLPTFMIYSERCNYIPHAEDQSYYVGKTLVDSRLGNKNFWDFNIYNGHISNIENIVIGVFTLWGIMRLVDLFKIMYLIDQRDKWSRFWHLVET